MLRKLAALMLTATVLGAGLGAARASAAGDANAASFVAKANAERSARGLRPYVVKSDLAAVAARHSARMAAKHTLYHNPALASEVSGWQVVGENVGDGGSVDSIHTAFMDSPAHRANILATDYTEIGIGTVTDDRGVIWVTQVFRLPYRAPAVAAPVTTRASRSVPRTQPRTAARPVAKAPVAVHAPRRPAPAPVPVRAEAGAFLAALAQGTAPNVADDPFALALSYAGTMSALAR